MVTFVQVNATTVLRASNRVTNAVTGANRYGHIRADRTQVRYVDRVHTVLHRGRVVTHGGASVHPYHGKLHDDATIVLADTDLQQLYHPKGAVRSVHRIYSHSGTVHHAVRHDLSIDVLRRTNHLYHVKCHDAHVNHVRLHLSMTIVTVSGKGHLIVTSVTNFHHIVTNGLPAVHGFLLRFVRLAAIRHFLKTDLSFAVYRADGFLFSYKGAVINGFSVVSGDRSDVVRCCVFTNVFYDNDDEV